MKILKKSFVRRMRFLRCALTLVSLVGLVVQSQAQPYVLSSQNSTVAIDVASGPGAMSDWVVDGVDQLNKQWFYYRVGNESTGQEYPVESIGAPTRSTPAANRLDVTYANLSYSVKLSYTLTGNLPGTGRSGLSESITVKNLTGSPLDFHFYQYSDFDLGGISGDQSVQIIPTLPSNNFSVTQTSGSGVSLTELAISAGVPYGLEAALYNLTLASLTDTSPTILNGPLTAGPGNVTFTGEWDMTISGSGTKIISKTLTIVPEPSSVTLILSGIVAWSVMHRRRRAA